MEALVALATLKLGYNTRGPRIFRDARQPDRELSNPLPGPHIVSRLAELLGVDEAKRAQVVDEAYRRASDALKAAERQGLTPVSVLDARYPALLREIPDPPIVLWCRGAAARLNDRPFVSIVGSRNATIEGMATSRRLARELAAEGIGVVSGMARGIDGAAHRGAADASGFTIAVLGCGADVVYPRAHTALAAEIAAAGALLSEYLPGTEPLPRHFPLRNRIISGLSQATVVVEASERSGSLITARSALDQGRDVLAVPGPVGPGCHRGCHSLIKEGARLVETVEDIFEELGWAKSNGPIRNKNQKSNPCSWLHDIMPVGASCDPDALSEKSGRPVAEVFAELCALEMAGLVERTGGGRFVRLD